MSTPRDTVQGRLRLTHEEAVLVSFLLSREIIEHRGSAYDGVQVYVQTCRDARNKVKRVVNRYADGPHTHEKAPSARENEKADGGYQSAVFKRV